MCRAVTCRKCTKTTWSGCGAHVDQVMRRVPDGDRCSCREDERAPGGARSSLLSRFRGR